MSKYSTTLNKTTGVQLKDIVGWVITAIVIAVSWFGTVKVNEALLDYRINSLEKAQGRQYEYLNDRIDKIDSKIEKIIEGQQRIELILKDKQDRK